MKIEEIVRIIAKMTGMNEQERKKLEEMVSKIEDIEDINDINDLSDINIESFSFETFEEKKRPGKRETEDFKVDNETKDIAVNPEDNENSRPYFGKDWVEIDGKFETFVQLDDNLINSLDSIDISLRDEENVHIGDPIDKKFETSEIPTTPSKIDAKIDDSGILKIQVW